MDDELFAELLAHVRQGGSVLRGQAAPSRSFGADGPPGIDVKRIREKHLLSQREFATMLGISVKTLQNWEQGRRVPVGPARVLLQVVAKHPDAVRDAVQHPTHYEG